MQEGQESARMQIFQLTVCKHANMMEAADAKGICTKNTHPPRAHQNKKGDLAAALFYEMQTSI